MTHRYNIDVTDDERARIDEACVVLERLLGVPISRHQFFRRAVLAYCDSMLPTKDKRGKRK